MTSVMPASSSASMAGSPRSWPARRCTLPFLSTASAASVRAYAEVSMCWSRISELSAAARPARTVMPRSVPQSCLAHDDVLADVHQTTGQVTRVGGTQSGVRQTLSSAVGVDEVLQHGQALTERGLDRTRDELTLRVGHQTLHACQRAGLGEVTRRTRVDDRDDRVVLPGSAPAAPDRPLRWRPARSSPARRCARRGSARRAGTSSRSRPLRSS